MIRKIKTVFLITAIITVAIVSVFASNSKSVLYVSPYPDGLNFAFTITDDPDGAKLEKIKPVYDLLQQLGFKTTIACWVSKPKDLEKMPDSDEQMKSDVVENEKYLEFLKKYKDMGFEIALHTVTAGHDKREDTIKGYEKFKEIFGDYPKMNIMHSKNKENIYWGKNVFRNSLMKAASGLYDKTPFAGEDKDSPYFWGDICRGNTKYVRLWGTSDINTIKFNPSMPYHDELKPYVNYWFSFSDGYNVKYFNRLLSHENVNRLIKERGASIVYAHFAAGFCKKQPDGKYLLNETTKNELTNLSRQKEGWFVPASTMLDRLLVIKNIDVAKEGKSVIITNLNSETVSGVTIIIKPFIPYSDSSGSSYRANEEGEILIGTLGPKEKKIISINEDMKIRLVRKAPNFWEKLNLVWQRLKIMMFEHRG